ncbi:MULTISPECIES: AraC family transcriptional regulator [unclassified Ensifer]|uniref:AraC family transcriptional regulator n=1 Tax=unclassified Ensifer TaxID=2633371 RepID=UPI000812E4EC|nr:MULTISPECIES: AraC family transcriptional regulator [unclassified Ensifer]OCP05671.1 AraC family transcriptional regulator [Ensifer sp. LC11]OCP06413.1 AraC family transcriptional regulator [Ensifer sp. LC13]OCP06861.1 AraC family transcriptional regulator [Ensifer sp. LC14]OCP31348.1 AraC family transcriptional regulator [Ensifer sp. LC499]
MTEATGVGACFGEPNAPFLAARPVRDARFSVTRLQCRLGGALDRLVSLPADDAYFLMFYFKDVMHCDVAPDGRDGEIQQYRQGSICLVDLAYGASVRLVSDLDSLAFHLPRALFREVAEFSHAPRAAGLRCRRGETDDVMLNLAQALLPHFGKNGSEPGPVLQHIAVAICAHLLHSYPDRPAAAGHPTLSVWQEKAAKDFMIEHWNEAFSLTAAAAATNLPERDFVERFASVTGQTPQQWLMRYRIGRAKRYLIDDGGSLADIAARCGFADEAGFIEAFCETTGVIPSVWRRRWLQ